MSIIPTASSPFFWLALCSTQCRDIEQGRQQEPSGRILEIPSLLLTFFHRDSFGREVVFHGSRCSTSWCSEAFSLDHRGVLLLLGPKRAQLSHCEDSLQEHGHQRLEPPDFVCISRAGQDSSRLWRLQWTV